MGPETDNFPFIQARFFRPFNAGQRPVRLIVIHTMEVPERDGIAKDIANDFANRPETNQASAHLCIDNKAIFQSVKDNDIAFAAPGANQDGIHLELAGRAAQTAENWQDAYSTAVLENAANAAAQYCLKYEIPVKHLTNAELADLKSQGFVGHVQVTDVFKKSTHRDPGEAFPWDRFLQRVEFFRTQRMNELNPAGDGA
ncbi:MAG: N-acetylmuramoyl-L-alanine amidase [Acidobacteriia bacterium]|nr:N-acetylmuramoyl-L-alanine amidase [Terriglobia bacterium]